MRLKSINHQSNSLGSLTHELKGRTRGGKCQDRFQRTLSMSCSDWEGYAGSLPTKVLGFFVCFWGGGGTVGGALSTLFDICGLLLFIFNQFSLAGLKRQHETSVSEGKVKLCRGI